MLFITHTFRDTRLFGSLKMLLPAIALSVAFYTATSVSAYETVTQTIVHESDVKDISEAASGNPGWYKEIVGSGAFTTNTVHPYSIAGSAELGVSDPGSSVELGLYNTLPSLRLDEITLLSYATIQTANNIQATSLQLGIDLDETDTDVSWQGRMVFEPYLNTSYYGDPLTDGIWQTWMTFKPAAVWWLTWSSAATAQHGANPCPQSAPCTLAQIKTQFPDVGLNAGFGNPLILKAGSGWNSFTGYFDAPSITTASGSKYWEFEPNETAPTGPVTKEDCFSNGWKNFGTTFSNQGQCISFVTHSNRNN